MRTTINLDDALMQKLKRRADETNKSISGVVNDILKTHLTGHSQERPLFRQQTHALGERPGINFHKSLDLAAELESDYTIDKLELGK
ncbi:MAG: hypothetical protein GVY29_12235 [Spirochaetes bacterium]|nr:hypothetical protein [Spirochaetota bacterium]